jgi:hypothetical protein
MSIPYESSTVLDTPMPSAGSYIEYPFADVGDQTTKIYNLKCVVKESDYTPIALNTPMTDAATADVTSLPFAGDSSAYFIGDSNHQNVDGAFRSFIRQFSNIPQPNTINSGTEVYNFPGLQSTAGVGSTITVNTLTSNNNVVSINTATAHGLSAGDTFSCQLKIQYLFNNRWKSTTYIAGIKTALSASGGSITFRGSWNITNFLGGFINPNATRGRQQVSRVSSTQIERTYYLPGVTGGITDAQDVAVEQPFAPYYYTEGNDVTFLRSNTTPTNNEYNQLIADDGYLILNEDVKAWKGNILVKESKQIRAI